MNALDELRFGADRTLDLHDSLPPADEAARRVEAFLRQHQILGSPEVLIITGRGSHSPDGQPVLKPVVERLLFSLRRRGVVESHGEWNPGAFAVRLAPIRAVVEAIPRNRERPARREAPVIPGLTEESNRLLRELAGRALDSLGVRHDESTLDNEMHRQLRAIAPGLRGGADMESALRDALQKAIAEYD